MKGIQGLILALGLGIAGALFNWAYLNRAAGDVDTVGFIGVAPDKNIGRGEPIREEDLVEVPIPAIPAAKLKDFAYRYEDRRTVVGMNVWREVQGGSLLLRTDLKSPPPALQFGQDLKTGTNEVAMFVPVDTRAIVPSLLVPGRDSVSFLVSRSRLGVPTPAEGAEGGAAAAPVPSPDVPLPAGAPELIGPFKILAVGNRLGDAEVQRAAKIPQLQENVIVVSVKIEGGKLETKAQRLLQLLTETNFRQVGVILHARQAK